LKAQDAEGSSDKDDSSDDDVVLKTRLDKNKSGLKEGQRSLVLQ
jgi:hypothetical protein